jgi:acyl-CoA thioesterase-1
MPFKEISLPATQRKFRALAHIAATTLIPALLLTPMALADPGKPSTDAVVKVACVGDSITAGVGSSSALHSYPGLLAAELGPKYDVENFGESGATLLKKGDSPYWLRPGLDRSKDFQPDVVVIMLGTNDSKPQNWSDMADFKGDYSALVDLYASLPSHPRIYVCTPPPVLKSVYGIREEQVEYEIPIIRQVAAEKNATVIDVYSAMGSDMATSSDGVHPNDSGYVLLATAVYEGLTGAPIIQPFGGTRFYQSTTAWITSRTPGAVVRYTLNGPSPTVGSAIYTRPLVLSTTTIVKAQTFSNDGKALGSVGTATFTLLTEHPAQIVDTSPGLNYSYYEKTLSQISDLTGASPEANGHVDGFSLDAHRRDTNFGFVFTGYIDVPSSGLYSFRTTSDDGSALLIDGEKIVDNDGLHGDSTVTGDVVLAAGKHAIRVDYIQGTGGYDLTVSWKGPEIAQQPIPASVLSHG